MQKKIAVEAQEKGPAHVSSKGEKEQRRCCCGALLARVVPEGIEIKCRRCRHFCLVPFVDVLSDETKALLSKSNQYIVLTGLHAKEGN